MKPGDLVKVDKGFAHKHGSGIIIATRSRYPSDPHDEELVATVIHTKTEGRGRLKMSSCEVLSEAR